MLSIAVHSASIIGNMTSMPAPLQSKLNLLGQRFHDHAVLKYSHANFAILLEMIELKVENSPLQKVFCKSV